MSVHESLHPRRNFCLKIFTIASVSHTNKESFIAVFYSCMISTRALMLNNGIFIIYMLVIVLQ